MTEPQAHLTGRQMYIPQPLEQFLLAEPWTFNITRGYDTRQIGVHFGHATGAGWSTDWVTSPNGDGTYPITLPADTLITMRCFRIKMGGNSSNHVTLRIEQPLKTIFSVKLAEFNKIRWKPLPNIDPNSPEDDSSEGDEVAAS